MPRLRIAIGLCLSLLLMLLAPVTQAQDDGWSLLFDPQAELSIETIRQPAQRELFTPLSLDQLYTPGANSASWLHLRLPPGQQRVLRVFSPFLDYLDLYLWQGEQLLSHTRTGNKLPLSSRPLPSRDFLLPLPASAQPIDLYLRLSSEQALRPDISLHTSTALAADDSSALLFGTLLGSLLMLVLYNLVRFAYVRTPSTLWLAATELAVLFAALTLLGISAPWLGAWQTAQSSILNLSILLSLLCALGFTASFFRQVCPCT